MEESVIQPAARERYAAGTAGGNDPAEFTGRYERVAKARDEAVRALEAQRTINETLGGRTQELESREALLVADLESTRKKLEQHQKDAEEAPRLREQLASVLESKKRQQTELEELAPWLESPEGQKAAEFRRDLVRTRIFAYAGWGTSALLCLGLAALYLYQKPAPIPVPDDDADRPPHKIV